MEYFIFGFNLLWPLLMQFFFAKTIATGEMFATIGLVLVLGFSSWAIGNHLDKLDTEIISGQVEGKKQVKVSCSHSYKCHCYTTCSGGKTRTCTQHCSTCYDHPYDFDWDVYTTIGEFEINRVDRQGTTEPPRWTQIKVADPVAREHSYVNYIKVAPDSLFNNLKNVNALPYVAWQEHDDEFHAVHTNTQKLTDHLDEVIGFPLDDPRPDYETLWLKFFEKFFDLSMEALEIDLK